MQQDVLSSPFPDVVERGVGWEAGGKIHSDQDYRAIVDRNTGKLFSIVSADYRVIRHEKAIEEVESVISEVPELGEYKVNTEFYNEGGRMRREYVFFEHEIAITTGDPVNPTLTLLNSYDTKWPFSVVLGAFRLICENGLVIGMMLYHIKKRHIYDLHQLYLKQGICTALNRFSEQVKKWNGWAEKELSRDTYDRVMDFMDLGKKGTEEIDNRMLQEGAGVDKEGFPIISIWLFYNTITWYITHRAVSLNHRVEMEGRLRRAIANFRIA